MLDELSKVCYKILKNSVYVSDFRLGYRTPNIELFALIPLRKTFHIIIVDYFTSGRLETKLLGRWSLDPKLFE